MAEKFPQLDSFVIPRGESVRLCVEYDTEGPVGAQTFYNGELDGSSTQPPHETEFYAKIPFDENGEHTFRILLEGSAPGDWDRLTSGDVDEPEEVVVIDAEWHITVIDEEELYQTDKERLKQIFVDFLTLYTAGSIAVKVYNKLLYIASDRFSEDDWDEIKSLDEFEEFDIYQDDE